MIFLNIVKYFFEIFGVLKGINDCSVADLLNETPLVFSYNIWFYSFFDHLIQNFQGHLRLMSPGIAEHKGIIHLDADSNSFLELEG